MWSWKVFRKFGLLGVFITIAGAIVFLFAGHDISLAEIGADAPFQMASQKGVNGTIFSALFLAILFVLVGSFGNLARALFSMTAHTIRSRELQFFNGRQSEASMLFSFFELDALGRAHSEKDEGL